MSAVVPADAMPLGHRVLVSGIIRAVAFNTGLAVGDLVGRGRKRPHVRARAAICWLARACTALSLPQLGQAVGGRDHSTILNLLSRAEQLRDADPAFRDLTNSLRAEYRRLTEECHG